MKLAHHPRLFLITAVLVASCRSEPAKAPAPAPSAERTAANEREPAQEEVVHIFDVNGALIPSDEFLVGIRLPRGLELFRQEPTRHTYRIRAPIHKVLAYFGPMLITGKVERQGKGAVYRQASVRGAEVNPTKVDVSILDIGDGLTRVSITELPPPPAYPPPQEETLKRAKRQFERLD
jgi:hypothetical protein